MEIPWEIVDWACLETGKPEKTSAHAFAEALVTIPALHRLSNCIFCLWGLLYAWNIVRNQKQFSFQIGGAIRSSWDVAAQECMKTKTYLGSQQGRYWTKYPGSFQQLAAVLETEVVFQMLHHPPPRWPCVKRVHALHCFAWAKFDERAL